ncbi:hypothetical protein [Desulfoluna spongiiphila]|uniref:Uncharacterized protein n=1 Tax=Desulfoluna spongiiphila TaxID=419481 RepID=A0A1G5B3A2_9BACT|nr:hypothetical protein [Desulfoluna spongiiphila]SCX84585.1 hypothetical protein SAMN05216233_101597 [Desulfoluna spongiiphila]
MFLLKTLFKVFVILPLVAVASFKATAMILAQVSYSASQNWWIPILVSVIASLAYLIWDGKREKDCFRKHAISMNIIPEYVASYGENGIAIDKTNSKVFAGRIGKGKVLDFHDVSSIEWEDFSTGNHMKYLIHLNTKDFDFPRISVGFSSNRSVREEAYAKLRAALNIN